MILSRNQEALNENLPFPLEFPFFYWGGNLLSMGHSTIPFSLLDRIQKNFNLQIGMEKETIEEINKMSNPYLNSFRMSLFIHDRDIC